MRLLYFLFFLFIYSVSFSCECPPLQPISKKLCDNYNVIFFGKVDSVSVCGKDGISTAYFTIEELYKGTVQKNLKVDFDCASAYMMSFEKNDEWIIYAAYQRFDLLTVNICEHSRKCFTDASQDFYFINAQRNFEQEKQFLKETFGLQSFVKSNEINKQQTELKPHNDQPSGLNKLFLLLISVAVMVVIFVIIRKIK